MGASQGIAAPTSQSTGTWSFSSSNPAIAAVAGATISGITTGTVTITATQAGTPTYASAIRTFTVTVKVAPAPRATASKSKRAITVKVSNAAGKPVIVKINGKTKRVGKNKVTPGKKLVTVQVQGRLILNKSFTVK